MWRCTDESERGIVFYDCVILRDEEYKDLGKMTVQKIDDGTIMIIVSIYGVTMRGLYFEEDEYPAHYETMKKDLTEIFEKDGSNEEKLELFLAFFDKHTSLKIYRRKVYGI